MTSLSLGCPIDGQKYKPLLMNVPNRPAHVEKYTEVTQSAINSHTA